MHYPFALDTGDLNGDGIADLAVGGLLEIDGRGCVAVYYGGRKGLTDTPAWIFDGTTPQQHVGWAVAIGDWNGDKRSDLAVGEWAGRLGAEAITSIRVFLGVTNGLATAPSQTFSGNVGRYLLHSPLVTRAGDVDGDGFDDLALDAADPRQPKGTGVVVVLSGSPEGLKQEPAWSVQEEQLGSGFATSVASAGDVNGDGFDDLIIGAPTYSGRYRRGGKAYLHLGSPKGLGLQPTWTSEYPLEVDRLATYEQFFSFGLGPAGDVNGDGFDDVIIGASYASQGESNEGAAFLFFGCREGLEPQPVWHVEGNRAQVHLGQGVRSAGDLNADGFADVIVGIPYAEHGERDEGVALVYYGSRAGLNWKPAWTLDGDQSNGHLGEWVKGAGDLNRDGLPDLLMAGVSLENPNEPRVRVVAVYGTVGGLQNSSGWRVDKPWLAVLQQKLHVASRWKVWFGTTSVALVAVIVMMFVQARMRRRIADLIEQNSALVLSEERARLARDIHDHLGADLTQLRMRLEQTLQEARSDTMRRQFLEMSGMAGRLLDSLRELVWATTPECDTLDSLINFLSEQSASFLETNGLGCDLDLPWDVPAQRVSAGLRHNLVLIVKEALNNVVKHGRASSVRIRLQIVDGQMYLEITDNGHGFDPAQVENGPSPSHHGGAGLRNLRTRANALKGDCQVESTPGNGTTITLIVPVTASRQGKL